MPDETTPRDDGLTPELRALYADPKPGWGDVALHPLGHGAPSRPAILNPDDSRTWTEVRDA